MSEMKLCRKCNENKPMSEFCQGENRCKACHSDEAMLWNKNHPEKRKIILKRYLEKRKSKIISETEIKRCRTCGLEKTQDLFAPWENQCKACKSLYDAAWREKNRERKNAVNLAWTKNNPERNREIKARYRYRNGVTPMAESKESASYLGVYIAERALSKFFDHIERMPFGNPGYDFVCGKGFKIDVKSACLRTQGSSPFWMFSIKKNTTPDYFLCLGFRDRNGLEPLRVWLIPGKVINNKSGLGISNIEKSLVKWKQYERPLDKVLACCAEMR